MKIQRKRHKWFMDECTICGIRRRYTPYIYQGMHFYKKIKTYTIDDGKTWVTKTPDCK
mgnify:CR=1 FL=1